MIILRLCLLTFTLLAAVTTINETVCIAEVVSLAAERVSSECLSCHDDIDDPNDNTHSGSHAIGIAYAHHAEYDEKLRPVFDLPSELILFEGVITCATCHGLDPHDGQLLVINNRESALCNSCHLK